MELIPTLLILLVLCSIATLIAKRINISTVIGLIITGIIIGTEPLQPILIGSHKEIILTLGNLGLLFLMFTAGLEVSWSLLYKERKDSFLIALFGGLTPFFLGTGVFLLLDFPLEAALTIGVCISITAEATKARVLLELKKLKTKVGSLMMGAGIVDDIIGVTLFLLVIYLATQNVNAHEPLMLSATLGVFFLGIFIHHLIGREHTAITAIEDISLYLVVPFFFIAMGIHFSFSSLSINPLFLILIITVAVLGKLIGTLATHPFITDLTLRQLFLIGWGMNSRGAVELAIAFIAYFLGLIGPTIYSSLIIMALVTTMGFPLIIKSIIRKDAQIMDE